MDHSSCPGGGCGSIEAEKEEIRLSYCEYEPPGEPSADLKNNLLRLLGGLWTAVDLKQSPDADTNPSDDFLIAASAVQHILKHLGLWCALQFVVITIEELGHKMVERMLSYNVEDKDEVKLWNDNVHNVLERIYAMLRSAAVCLNVGNATEMIVNDCSNLVETVDSTTSTTMMSPSQTPPGVSFSTYSQVRMLRFLLLKHEEELKAQGIKRSIMLPANTRVLVFVNKQSTALVIHRFLSEVLKPLTCDYLLGASKSPDLRDRETEAICAFKMGKTHILVVVAGTGSGELPDVGLAVAFDDKFEGGFELEQISKYLRNSNGSLILMNEMHKEDIRMKQLRKLSSVSIGSQSHHSTTEKEQMEGAAHSMAQTGQRQQSIQGRRLHRGHRDSTNSLEAKNNRMQQQQLMDHSVVAPLTAEALNLLEVSTLLCQQPSIFMELLIHPLCTTAIYNMNTLGCVKFDVGQPTENGSPLPLGFATLTRLPKHIMNEFGLGEPSIYFGLKPEQVQKLIQWHRACVDVFVRGKRPNINEIIMEYQREEKTREEEDNADDILLDKGYIFVPLKLSLHNSSGSNPITPSLDWTSIDAFLSTSEEVEEGNAAKQENPFDLEGIIDFSAVWCRLSAKKARMYFIIQAMSLTYGEYMDRLEEKRSMRALVPPSSQVEQEKTNSNKHKKVALEWESLVCDHFPPPIGLSVEESKALSLAEWYTPAQREASNRDQHLYLAYPAASAKEVFFHHVELAAYKLSNAHDIITTHVAATTLSTGDDDVLRLGIRGGGADVNMDDNTKIKFRHRHTGPPRMLIPQYLTHVKLPRMICGALMMIGPLAYDLERCLAVHKFADEVFRPAVLNTDREWQCEPATHFLSCALQHGGFVGERLELFGDHWLGFYIALYIILAVKEEELMCCYHADLVCNARLLVAAKKMGISSLLPSPRYWSPSICAVPKVHSNLNWKTVPDVMEALIGCFVLTAGDYCGEALLEYMGYHTVSGLLKCQGVDKPPSNLTTTPTGNKSMEEGRMSSPGGDAVGPSGQNEAAPGSNTNGFHTWPLCRGSFVHFQSILTYGTIFPVEYISTCPGPDLMICVLQVEKALGYKFRIPWLCLQALTHSSSVEEDPLWLAEDATATTGHVMYVKSSDYERLYFLGSFILNYIVMVHLYHLNTMFTPEDLTNLRSSITVSTRLNLLATDTLGLLALFRGKPHVQNAVAASISGENNDNYTMAKEMFKILKSLMAAIFLDSDGCLAAVSDVFWPFLAPNNTRDKQLQPPERCADDEITQKKKVNLDLE